MNGIVRYQPNYTKLDIAIFYAIIYFGDYGLSEYSCTVGYIADA